MKKEEILEMYCRATYNDVCNAPELSPIWYVVSPSGIRITGYPGDDGVFYFVEVIGYLSVRDWEGFFANAVLLVSIDYSYTQDGVRFALVGLQVPDGIRAMGQ